MSKIQPVVTRLIKTFRKERTYDVFSIQRESGNGTKNTRKKRHYLQTKGKKKHVLISGCMHIEGRLNEGPRLQRKHKTKTKQNKTNITPEKGVMASANQTPGGYNFAPLMASQQGRANQHEPACFGLSTPWSFPSRSGIPLHAVVQPWLSLQRSTVILYTYIAIQTGGPLCLHFNP